MPRYSGWMVSRPRLVLFSFLVSLGFLSGCGDESGTLVGSPASESQVAGIELGGNVVNPPESQSILVFAFARSGEAASDEPVNVGLLDEQGQFTLSGLPSGRIGLTFLADSANDGVIDSGDPVAHLADPDQQLEDLRSGDRVQLTDVQLDFRHNRAVAGAIEVARRGDSPPPESTPTPER
jgi:hypothetical protein